MALLHWILDEWVEILREKWCGGGPNHSFFLKYIKHVEMMMMMQAAKNWSSQLKWVNRSSIEVKNEVYKLPPLFPLISPWI